jgi:molybdopterin synthase sulfur carrier subunit
MLTVRAFARYRSLLGFDRILLPVPTPADLGSLLSDSRFQSLPKDALLAVNQRFAGLDFPLNDGDEVALLPPVSGG